MDVNIALVAGRLAVAPDLERLSDGSVRARLLVHVRSERRSRFDVLPVVVPPDVAPIALESVQAGSEVLVAGPLMRWCPGEPWEPVRRVELVAEALRFPELESERCPSAVLPEDAPRGSPG